MGGLLGSVVDRGGTYPARIRRMAAAGICGGAGGLVLGGLVHGHGWLTVALLVLVAGISALMSAAGATAAITGLQLLVYTILGTGPLGELRPWWWPPLLLLGGVGWALLLLVPAWLTAPLAAEQRSTAGAYRALARMLRGIGTMVGAVLGAIVLVVIPAGPLLLIPCALFAGLLPYGRDRNWGLFTTFLTPLVVILIDLLHPTGWPLALDRLIDTTLGCAIVLLVGYAPWPSSWQAHLPTRLAVALDSVARYTEQALLGQPGRSALRRQSYRALSDLRTEFQRTMAEPPSVSRRAARLWPALNSLEQVTDTVTATAVRADAAGHRPDPGDVAELVTALRELARSVRDGQLPGELPRPDSDDVRPLADGIGDVRRALTGEHAA